MKIQSLAEFRGKITGAILYDLLKVIEDAGLTTGLQHGECFRAHLHPSVPFSASGDVLDGQ
jgi:hypothetical protein